MPKLNKELPELEERLPIVHYTNSDVILGELGIVIKSDIEDALANLLIDASSPTQLLVISEKIALDQDQQHIGLLTQILSLQQNHQTKQFIVHLKTLQRVKIFNLRQAKDRSFLGNYTLYSDIKIRDTEKLSQIMSEIQGICKNFLYIPLNQQKALGRNLQKDAYNFSFYIVNQISKEVAISNVILHTQNGIQRLQEVKQYCVKYLDMKNFPFSLKEKEELLLKDMEEQIIAGKLVPLIKHNESYENIIILLNIPVPQIFNQDVYCILQYLKLRKGKNSYLIFQTKQDCSLNTGILARIDNIRLKEINYTSKDFAYVSVTIEKIVKVVKIHKIESYEYAKIELISCFIGGEEAELKELIGQSMDLMIKLLAIKSKTVLDLPNHHMKVIDYVSFAESLSIEIIKASYKLTPSKLKVSDLLREPDLLKRFRQIRTELLQFTSVEPEANAVKEEAPKLNEYIKQVKKLPKGYIPALFYTSFNEIVGLSESKLLRIHPYEPIVTNSKVIKLFYAGKKDWIIINGSARDYAQDKVVPAISIRINHVSLQIDNILNLHITLIENFTLIKVIFYNGMYYSKVKKFDELLTWSEEEDKKLKELIRKVVKDYTSEMKLNDRSASIPLFDPGIMSYQRYVINLSFYIFSNLYNYSERKEKLEKFWQQNVFGKYETLLQTLEDNIQKRKILDTSNHPSTSSCSITELNKRTDLLPLPSELKIKILDLSEQLKFAKQDSSDFRRESKYINTILQLPWDEDRKFTFDKKSFRERIDEEFYGLAKVKDKITDILSFFSFSQQKPRIIALHGQDKDGKTALSQAVAIALGREIVPINILFTDSDELCGVPRSYHNGKLSIISAIIHKYKSTNLVVYLRNFAIVTNKGYINVLSSILDINTNKAFFDRYIDFSMNYSNILFILDIENEIPSELEPLVEKIRIQYTAEEKIDVIKNFLIPQVANELNLTTISIKDDYLENFVKNNTTRSLGYLKEEIKKMALTLAQSSKEDKVVKITSLPNEDSINNNMSSRGLLLTAASNIVQIESRIATLEDGTVEKEKALQELSRLKIESNNEQAAIRNYLVQFLNMPWLEKSETAINFNQSEEILRSSHYGLEKVKERIIEFLAVVRRAGTVNSPILCLVGPPGVGKTSLAESIAKAVGRKYVRLALGGVSDDSIIRGHMRTYTNATPGMIIQLMQQVGVKNPVMLLDEIDKTDSSRSKSSVENALLELLDPKQNKYFTDHYLQVPFDLSNVMFITTANNLDNISLALRDRLEIIKVDGYTDLEKLNICKLHIIPKIISDYGLKEEKITFTDSLIQKIIRGYTRESGVRNLEQNIKTILRKILKKTMETKEERALEDSGYNKAFLTEEILTSYLGNVKFTDTIADQKGYIGKVAGLSYTQYGGNLLFIEAIKIIGKGKVKFTGSLGEVLKESIEAAYSYLKSQAKNLKVDEKEFKHHDIHVHLPEGATPKDGPSAGVAIYLAIVSAMTERIVKSDIAMTGEIDLMGTVLKIGGLKEKLLAAQRSQVKTVIIPEANLQDLTELPIELKDQLEIIGVKSVEQILDLALEPTEKVSHVKGTSNG